MAAGGSGRPAFLVHKKGDNVAVAVDDLVPGVVEGGYLTDSTTFAVEMVSEVPLGHKFALREVGEGAEVIEYGAVTGIATRAIGTGEYAHIHNVRSARWQNSVV